MNLSEEISPLISMAKGDNSVLLHAGTTETWAGDPEFQKAAEQTLFEIASKAGSILTTESNSIDVIENVMTLLKDCSLFDACRGAVLNEKGVHKVR